jgi:phosphopantothenoylcysteine decarboxylase/phosphopantothenate--cysteine ligase
VSDFSTKKREGKIDSKEPLTLNLSPTRKIINRLKKLNPQMRLVGFKAISATSSCDEQTILHEAEKLFKDARVDMVVVNDISRHDIGFESDENEAYIIDAKKRVTKIQKTSKPHLAEEILKRVIG